MLISQDTVRREMLYAKDGYDTPALPLLTSLVRYTHENSSIAILEGILHSGFYRPMFEVIRELYGGNVFAYYYDIPFEETVRQHRSRDKAAEFDEDEMRKWWLGRDHIGIIPEKTITQDISLEAAVDMIYNDVSQPNSL